MTRLQKYAEGLLNAIRQDGDLSRFSLTERVVAGVPCVCVSCLGEDGEEKVVALVLMDGDASLEEICEAAVASVSVEGVDEEPEDDDEPAYVREVEGRVVKPRKARGEGWNP